MSMPIRMLTQTLIAMGTLTLTLTETETSMETLTVMQTETSMEIRTKTPTRMVEEAVWPRASRRA